MRKNVFGRRLKRDKNQRKALFKGLMSSLVLEERIKTTEEKAKAIKGKIEKLVTKVKKNGASVRNQLQEYLVPKALEKFVTDTALRFSKRPGGYTRLVKIGKRFDSSSMVLMEWVEGKAQSQMVSLSKPVLLEGAGKGQTKPKTKTKRVVTTKPRTNTKVKKGKK